MLWGRRSERRNESPDQQHLNFGEEPVEPPSAEQQEIIMAQAKADEALDQELLRRLEQRRKAHREKKKRREEFPSHIERRERIIDLSEEQKQGLKWIGDKVTERLGELCHPTSLRGYRTQVRDRCRRDVQRQATTRDDHVVVHDDLVDVGEEALPPVCNEIHKINDDTNGLGTAVLRYESVDQVFLNERLLVGREHRLVPASDGE